jgi:hypothetical protein
MRIGAAQDRRELLAAEMRKDGVTVKLLRQGGRKQLQHVVAGP